MTVEILEKRILEAFSDCQVAAQDQTGMGNHFEVRLTTPDLKDLTRVERHQKVMALFSEELDSGELHALSIKYLKA